MSQSTDEKKSKNPYDYNDNRYTLQKSFSGEINLEKERFHILKFRLN